MAQVPELIERIRVLIGDMSDDVNEHRHSDTYLKKALRVTIEQDKGLDSIGLSDGVTSTGDAYIEYSVSGLSDAGLSLYTLATSIQVFESELRQYIADGGGIATAIGPSTYDEKTVLNSLVKLLAVSKEDYKKALHDYNFGSVLVPVRVDLYATGTVD